MRSRASRNGLSEEEVLGLFYLLDVLTSQKKRKCEDIVSFQREKKKTVSFEDGRLSPTCIPRSYNRCFSSLKLVDEWIEDQHCCDDVGGEVIVVGASSVHTYAHGPALPFPLDGLAYQAAVSSPSRGNVSFPISTVEQHSSGVRRSFSLGRRFSKFYCHSQQCAGIRSTSSTSVVVSWSLPYEQQHSITQVIFQALA